MSAEEEPQQAVNALAGVIREWWSAIGVAAPMLFPDRIRPDALRP